MNSNTGKPFHITQALWDVTAEGAHMKPVLPGWSNPPAEDCGNWTPDGRYFVFISHRVPNTMNLFALEERGGFLRRRNPEPTQLTQIVCQTADLSGKPDDFPTSRSVCEESHRGDAASNLLGAILPERILPRLRLR